MSLLNWLHKGAIALQNHGLVRLAGYAKQAGVVLYGADISPRAKLGAVLFPHPSGVVIGAGSVVEDDCKILSGVVLGVAETRRTATGKVTAGPVVRRGAIVGSGAKIIGSVEIGEYSVIGANAVVTDDVPPRCVAAGVPARVIRHIDDPSELSSWIAP